MAARYRIPLGPTNRTPAIGRWVCSAEGCENEKQSLGMCPKHYEAARTAKRKALATPCAREGCENIVRARGLCNTHYQRARAAGSLPKLVPAPRKDSANFPNGRTINKEGYVNVWTPELGNVLEHRAVMSAHLGRRLAKGENIHHINGVRDDNRIQNLELWHTVQPRGQRVEQLIAYMVEFHSDRLIQELGLNRAGQGEPQ